MSHGTLHQVVPSLIMAGAVAIPIATTVNILTHVSHGGGTTSLLASAPRKSPISRSAPATGQKPQRSSTGATHTYSGPVVQQPYGGVQAVVTFTGRKISGVSITAPNDNGQSAYINQQAVPLLQQETLQVQSAQINGVSGATETSQAYAQSLQAALDQARAQGV